MVQNKVGRPRQFNRDAALAAAVEVFWLNGYDGASLEDLTQAMGINRPSLYSAFGDKQALYLAALSSYGERIGRAPLEAFKKESDPKSAVRAFFQTLLNNQTRPGDVAQGCLWASCAVASAEEIPAVKTMLSTASAATVKILEEEFETYKRSHQLPETFPSRDKAKLIMDIMHGYAYRTRLNEPRRNLMADLESKIDHVLCHIEE